MLVSCSEKNPQVGKCWGDTEKQVLPKLGSGSWAQAPFSKPDDGWTRIKAAPETVFDTITDHPGSKEILLYEDVKNFSPKFLWSDLEITAFCFPVFDIAEQTPGN